MLWFLVVGLVLSTLAGLAPPPVARAGAPDQTAPATGPPVDSELHAVAVPAMAQDVTPEVLYYHPDATGNLVAMTDESGQVAWRADMRPFGQGTANPPDHPLRFLDQPRESNMGAGDGLYHLGARVYDPLAGRFLSPDPLPLVGVALAEPQRFNQYAYGLNNPYRYVDPSGFAPKPSKKPKRQLRPRRDPVITGDPEGVVRPPKVIDLPTDEPVTEIIPLPGTVTEEVTEVQPVRTGQTTPSLGEVVPEGFDPENPDNVDTDVNTTPDKKMTKAEQAMFEWEMRNQLACHYGMDSCRPHPVWGPAVLPVPGGSTLPVPTGPRVPVRVPVRIPIRIPVPVIP